MPIPIQKHAVTTATRAEVRNVPGYELLQEGEGTVSSHLKDSRVAEIEEHRLLVGGLEGSIQFLGSAFKKEGEARGKIP